MRWKIHLVTKACWDNDLNVSVMRRACMSEHVGSVITELFHKSIVKAKKYDHIEGSAIVAVRNEVRSRFESVRRINKWNLKERNLWRHEWNTETFWSRNQVPFCWMLWHCVLCKFRAGVYFLYCIMRVHCVKSTVQNIDFQWTIFSNRFLKEFLLNQRKVRCCTVLIEWVSHEHIFLHPFVSL